MDVFLKFATDQAKENEGVWVPVGDGRMKVARFGNRRYAKLLSKLVEKNQKELDVKDDAADDLSDELLIEVLAHTILLDFEGFQYNGEPLPYSKDNAKKVLAVKDFRQLVIQHSQEFENFKASTEAAAVKN